MLVSAMHITAAVFVNDNESGLHSEVFYAEFDGQRDKRLIVKIMGE